MNARSTATWSAGMVAVAAAAVMTAVVTSTGGSAAALDVDGGVLQLFSFDGPVPAAAALLLADGAPTTDVLDPLPPRAGGPEPAAVAGAGPLPAAPIVPTAPAATTTPVTSTATATPTVPAPAATPPVPGRPAAAPAAPIPAPDPRAVPPAAGTPVYEDCAAFREVRDPELEPLVVDDPAYRVELDEDGDGVACTDADLAASGEPVSGDPVSGGPAPAGRPAAVDGGAPVV